jgi:hypothetical protein
LLARLEAAEAQLGRVAELERELKTMQAAVAELQEGKKQLQIGEHGGWSHRRWLDQEDGQAMLL